MKQKVRLSLDAPELRHTLAMHLLWDDKLTQKKQVQYGLLDFQKTLVNFLKEEKTKLLELKLDRKRNRS